LVVAARHAGSEKTAMSNAKRDIIWMAPVNTPAAWRNAARMRRPNAGCQRSRCALTKPSQVEGGPGVDALSVSEECAARSARGQSGTRVEPEWAALAGGLRRSVEQQREREKAKNQPKGHQFFVFPL
jgi:hypothetical protein